MAVKKGVFVWVDCEMTGLELYKEALLEVAVIVTDESLTPVAEGMDVVIKPEQKYLDDMNSYVQKMHRSSGLLKDLEAGISLQNAADQVYSYVKRYAVGHRKALLAGNSVGQDRLFLSRDMPAVIEHLHYRIIDVTTLKELAKQWYPKIYQNAPEKTGNHRALGDIQDSIRELEYYRRTIFVNGRGAEV